ncbi:MAG TPA: hypothetical protein VHJ99_07945 [Candidatus Dormibacteraeota bacterium]|nr:hypothetical protein [Candidatus Dormibacteraeota bacterium]
MNYTGLRRSWFKPLVRSLVLALVLVEALATAAPASANSSNFNRPGNILIADQFNNRAIEIDRHHNIVWQFGVGPKDLAATSILGVNDAQRVGDLTLMAGTGIPPKTAQSPFCTDKVIGCPDNRVILVDRKGKIVWQYGTFGVIGSGPNELNTPVQDTYLPNGNILITDQANERIIEVNHEKEIVWQYGTTGMIGPTGTPDLGDNFLNNPNSAELLANGHILISDENNNRAIEVNRDKHILRTFTAGATVSGVAFASRLKNGNTLLTDSNNSRIVEVNAKDQVVWHFETNTDTGTNAAPLPTRAVRLRNGHTLISDQFNDRVIEVTHSKRIVFTAGTLNVFGMGGGLLNAPYDAKVVGDFTGLTPPFGDEGDD